MSKSLPATTLLFLSCTLLHEGCPKIFAPPSSCTEHAQSLHTGLPTLLPFWPSCIEQWLLKTSLSLLIGNQHTSLILTGWVPDPGPCIVLVLPYCTVLCPLLDCAAWRSAFETWEAYHSLIPPADQQLSSTTGEMVRTNVFQTRHLRGNPKYRSASTGYRAKSISRPMRK